MQPQPNRRRCSPTAIVIVPLAVALVMTLFAWPSARLEPRDLPVGVAGPANAVQPIEQRIAAADGSFDVHHYADEAAARQAIEDRDIYGAVVMTQSGPKALTASAASRTVAQTLTNLLRSTGFFDGAAAGGHVAVLAAWVLAGVTLMLVVGLRGRRPVAAPVPQPA
jgi:hypothetical protein